MTNFYIRCARQNWRFPKAEGIYIAWFLIGVGYMRLGAIEPSITGWMPRLQTGVRSTSILMPPPACLHWPSYHAVADADRDARIDRLAARMDRTECRR